MSCDEREVGSYSLPVGEFKRLEKHLTQAHKNHVTNLFAIAERVYQKSKQIPAATFNEWLDTNRNVFFRDLPVKYAEDLCFFMSSPLRDFLVKGKNGKLTKPTKMALKKAIDQRETRNGIWNFAECYELLINPASKTVVWDVQEGNNACSYARAHPVAQAFFKFLPTVKWRGATGGSIRYLSEYMEEDGPACPQIINAYGKVNLRNSLR
jgi:hypothetical protein